MSKNIVIAVDANEQSLDAVALGKLLAGATAAPVVVVTVMVVGSTSRGPLGRLVIGAVLGRTMHRLMSTAACPALITPRGTSLELAGP